MNIKICNTQGKRYNEAARSYFDLEEGEVWCYKCHGAGQFPWRKMGNHEVAEHCGTCEGAGKLDWIERIVGKKKPFDYETYFAKETADAIDEEILESVIAESNKMKKEGKL